MINFDEAPLKINGHVSLGTQPTLAQGEWTGRSLDEMSEPELRAVIGRMLTLCNDKFPREG